MTQFNAPVRRAGGSLDVYAGLLFAALLALAVGVFVMVTTNIEHSAEGPNNPGGVLKLVQN
ncbi:MAG: hypothetical protein JSV91_07395 [Phycisphaerales bacterium]|nr:MAG: hypothetical protein JSV91_07395 [Phycisphaerales bacterium]